VLSPAPTSFETVTSPAWLGEALGARVARIEVVARGHSLASRARIRVEYADPGCTLPARLFLKGFFHPEDAGYVWVGEPEALFFRDIAPSLTARIPRCFYAGVDPANRHGMAILEDLDAQGCHFFSPLEVNTPEGVAATLEQLARVHADTWNRTDLESRVFLEPVLDHFLGYAPVERLQELLAGPRGAELPEEIRRAERIRSGVRKLFERLHDGRPRCLVHGDAHLGNTYATAGGERGLLDWQIVQRAYWAWDVSYHVATALPVRERRAAERKLLAHYLGRLRELGVAGPSPEDAWTAYREAAVYGYNLWAIASRVAEPITVEFVTRLGTAVADHRSFELLGV
jgi:hypothetical protein